jgi:hypothetical protein
MPQPEFRAGIDFKDTDEGGICSPTVKCRHVVPGGLDAHKFQVSIVVARVPIVDMDFLIMNILHHVH